MKEKVAEEKRILKEIINTHKELKDLKKDLAGMINLKEDKSGEIRHQQSTTEQDKEKENDENEWEDTGEEEDIEKSKEKDGW